MDNDTNGLLTYVALVAIASVAANSCLRRFWLAFGIVVAGCSVLNIIHEVVTHDFRIRPSDAVFWLPMLMAYGVIVATPIVLLTGLPFHFCRRRAESKMPPKLGR